jgi:DNA-binding transcriptional regulator YiaG
MDEKETASAQSPPPVSLSEARRLRGLSMEALAERMRVTRPAVSAWESGAASPGGPARIVLSQIFEVPLDVIDVWFARSEAA